MAHLADPIDGWLPLNRESLHYGYFANNPEFHIYDWMLVTNRWANRLRGRWVSGQVFVARVIK